MKAEEMFKELGYEKTYDKDFSIIYTKYYDEERCEIEFHKFGKANVIECTYFCFNEFEEEVTYPSPISIEELKAINRQVEELGWLGVDKE